MNFLLLFLVTLTVITYSSIETDGSVYNSLKYGFYGAAIAPVAFAPVALAAPVALLPVAAYAVARPSHIPFLLLVKLLLLKKALFIGTPAIAVGSLIAGSGIGLLAGKYETLHSLHHHGHHHHHGYGHGWGWHGSGWGWGWKHELRAKLKAEFRARLREFWLRRVNRFGLKTARFVNTVNHLVSHHGHGWNDYLDYGHDHGHHYGHDYGHHYGHGHDHDHGYVVQGPTYYSESKYVKSPAHYDVDSHDHGHSYSHGHGDDSTYSTHYEGAADDGHSYTTSHDGYHSESKQESKVVPAPSQSNRREEIRQLTNEEYFSGVLKFAAEPFANFMYGIADDTFGSKEKKSKSAATATPETEVKAKSPIVKREVSKESEVGSEKPWEFPGLSLKESEAYLEEHFATLKSDSPKEAMDLITILRQAYGETLLNMGIKDSEKVPEFIPMPAEHNLTWDPLDILLNRTVTPAKRKTEAEITSALDAEMAAEAQQFFALLSTFDNEMCFEKLICEIHTRINDNLDNFAPYEINMISVFDMLESVFTSEKQPDATTLKYMKAADYGEQNLSPGLCKIKYSKCRYSSKQVIDMGAELDKSSTFSIPAYLRNHLKK